MDSIAPVDQNALSPPERAVGSPRGRRGRVYVIALFAGIFYFSRLHHGGGPQSYIGTQGGLACITAMVTGNGPVLDIWPVLERLAGVVLGVALMVSVSFVLAALRAARAPEAPLQAPAAN